MKKHNLSITYHKRKREIFSCRPQPTAFKLVGIICSDIRYEALIRTTVIHLRYGLGPIQDLLPPGRALKQVPVRYQRRSDMCPPFLPISRLVPHMDPLTLAMKVNPARNHPVLWVAHEAYVKWYVTGPIFVVLRRAYNEACFSFSVLLGVLASGFSIGYTNTYFCGM